MARTRAKDRFAYAMCEGSPIGKTGRAGIGVVVRDGAHRRVVSTSRQVGEECPARARLAAIAEALRLCKSRGIERVTVYCHDDTLVRKIATPTERDPQTRAGCLEVRALLNTFRRAEVRSLPWLANLEAAWLARQAASQPCAESTRRYQPTLPLDAA